MRYENPTPELHPEFIESLRVLFEILDTSRTGRVRYETLCARFGELNHPHLPPTFLSYVRKVAPANGLVSFERFLTAVKLAHRDTVEINNNNLHRVQSEGRLCQNIDKRRMQAPAMGVNGFDRRSVIHGSQTTLNESRYSRAQSADRPPTYAEVRGSDPLYGNLCSYADLHGVKPYVAMRVKKGSTVRSQKEESRMRHAMPPSSTVTKVAANRPRPQSTNSYHSLASSGLENVTWRNSSLSISTDSQRRQTRYEDDTSPKMEKMENLLREELQLVQKGMETAQKLCDWYSERLSSLEKRKRLLEQGKVSLECAVHEQKLNLLRAHLTELNRRMVSLMETSERGFPFHVNLQKVNVPSPQDDQLTWLHRQNMMLNQELGAKTRLLEAFKREKEEHVSNEERPVSIQRIQPQRPAVSQPRPSAFVRPAFHYQQMQHAAAVPVKSYDTLM